MISYERLLEIVCEAERVRCNQLYERFEGECKNLKGGCDKCIVEALCITEEEYLELFGDSYGL